MCETFSHVREQVLPAVRGSVNQGGFISSIKFSGGYIYLCFFFVCVCVFFTC